ncbi:hypothetical protein [Clostridium sp. SY8519]|uniref:hypothetical protein n=1 Tax=Clostridium sp. (strain SY8519) TaxID=1042156 RepID=UPI0011D18A5A|nr:hypothetical protein [Clostridium sp. SY8519]
MRSAVEISYLGHLQHDVYECMEKDQCIPTQSQAMRMRKLHAGNQLNRAKIIEILEERKPNQVPRIILHGERFWNIMPEHLHKQEYEEYIAEAIEHYNHSRLQQSLAKAGD